jgi:hypothetical protein
MSLALVATPERLTLRRQARFLILWTCFAGLACSALLLHRYAVHSMAIRYAASATAMYFLGWVVGAYACLRWWGAKTPSDANFPQEALPGDAALYHQQVIDQRAHWFSISRWWNLGQDDDDDDDDEVERNRSLLGRLLGWIFQLVIGFVFSIVATLVGLVFGYLPIVVAEALAGFLAVLVVKFVIASRAMVHYSAEPMLSGYWLFAIEKTGPAAVGCIAAAGAAGYWLEVSHPAAADLLDIVLPANLPAILADLHTYLPSFLSGFVH